MNTKKDIAIQLKGTNEGYLLHFPQTAIEDPMPLHDKIIVQLLAEIEQREAEIQTNKDWLKNVYGPEFMSILDRLEKATEDDLHHVLSEFGKAYTTLKQQMK